MSSSRRVYKQLQEQQQRLLAQQAELANLKEGGSGGAQNDLNVLAQSPVFDELLQGNSPRCTYTINGTQYEGSYYLADGIYPRWSTFVKTVPHPHTEKEKHFAKCQEGCRKDVERCFGILQARWAIIRAAARMFDVEALRSIMMTCIILHNMIVEDEYDYDGVDEYEPDPRLKNTYLLCL
ncbi:uncharacterized protein [Malus domestica]|uniref:uncharacterized protein n=1 Tax=Malus domestica TaxID=3750 RepID=UPI00397638B0